MKSDVDLVIFTLDESRFALAADINGTVNHRLPGSKDPALFNERSE